MYVFIYLFIFLFIHLFTYLFIYLFIYFASKEAYPIVRQLEKITVKKVQAEVVKCAKSKSWALGPPWSLKC